MIDQLFWNPDGSFDGRDLHLLANGQGCPISLLGALFVHEQWSTAYQSYSIFKNSHKSIQVQFDTVNLQSGLGVSVNQTTGLITVQTTVNADLHNFLVSATVTLNPDPAVTIYVRCHIHRSINKAWLTPNTLTAYRDCKYKFSIYAHFDDDVIGDISSVIPFTTWNPTQGFSSGFYKAPDSVHDDIAIPVTAILPGYYGSAQVTGNLIPKTFPKVVDLITSGKSPGFSKLNECPNILILPDGFSDTPTDKANFENLTDTFVRRLAKETTSRPYDVLSDSINYWRVFEPSRERGCGMFNEVYFTGSTPTQQAWPLELPQPQVGAITPASAASWTIENLIFYVGVPIPSQGGMSPAQLRPIWSGLFTTTVPISSILDTLINEWTKRAKRHLLEEKDTLLGCFRGTKPRASPALGQTMRLFDQNTNRLSRISLTNLLGPLQDSSSNQVGSVWHYFPQTQSGKDWDTIIYLSNAADGRANNSDGFLLLSANTDPNPRIPLVVENVSSLSPMAYREKDQVPSPTLDIIQHATIVHEISHSFTLGDEYGELNITTASPLLRYTGPASAINDSYSNIQLESDVLSGSNIDGTKVKWRWHRITESAVLISLASTGAQFEATVQAGQATNFKDQQIVFLRARAFQKPLSATVKLASFKVSGNPTGDIIKLDAQGATINIADFPAGSIIYCPKITSAPTTNYPFAELISLDMINFLSHGPLTGAACTIDNRAIQSPNLAGFPVPAGKHHPPRIVGLYSGGYTYHCGIFHPTGVCIMRNPLQTQVEFCVVCRYLLVDQINPVKHKDIEKDYDIIVAPK